MAGIKSIQAARVAFEEALLAADLLRQAMDEVARDNTSPVMEVFSRAIYAVHQAGHAYLDTIHQHAMPVLVDHEKATASLKRA